MNRKMCTDDVHCIQRFPWKIWKALHVLSCRLFLDRPNAIRLTQKPSRVSASAGTKDWRKKPSEMGKPLQKNTWSIDIEMLFCSENHGLTCEAYLAQDRGQALKMLPFGRGFPEKMPEGYHVLRKSTGLLRMNGSTVSCWSWWFLVALLFSS